MQLHNVRSSIAILYFLLLPAVLGAVGGLTPTRLLIILTVAAVETSRRRFLPHIGMTLLSTVLACSAAVVDPRLAALAPAAALAGGGGGRGLVTAVAGILAAVTSILFSLGLSGAFAGEPAGALAESDLLYRLSSLILLAIMLGLGEYLMVRLQAGQDENRQLGDAVRDLRIRFRKQRIEMQHSRDELAGRIELTERNRIARALHDALGHGLTGALWQLRAADELLARDDVAPARESLQRGIAAVDGGLAAIRSTVRDLQPREVPDIDALKQLAGQFAFCPVKLQFSGDPAGIPGGVLAVFCDNVRELLTNTARHSRADQVRISVARAPGFCRLEYRDNGVGLQDDRRMGSQGERRGGGFTGRPAAGSAGQGMGLDGIRSRTEAIGGHCSFGTDGSSGFVCVCLVQGESQ